MGRREEGVSLTPIDLILGGVAFIVTLRLIGLRLGQQYHCRAMRRGRIVGGAVLYTLAVLAIVAGVIGMR